MSTTERSFKRPYQSSIGSYLGQSTRDSGSTAGTQMLAPRSTLPTAIQSSLLNVGMRVRKSVPEGYRTQPKLSCGLTDALNNPTSEHDSVTPPRGFTGLVPYCGILRTGGHNIQPAPAEEDLPPLLFDCDDCGFMPSQESTASSDSLRPTVTLPVVTSHKHLREDEDDELDAKSQSISPRSYPPFSHTRMPNLDRLRPIALPRTRKKQKPVYEWSELKESEMIDVGDFEEA